MISGPFEALDCSSSDQQKPIFGEDAHVVYLIFA